MKKSALPYSSPEKDIGYCELPLCPDSNANFGPDRIARFNVQYSAIPGLLNGQASIAAFGTLKTIGIIMKIRECSARGSRQRTLSITCSKDY